MYYLLVIKMLRLLVIYDLKLLDSVNKSRNVSDHHNKLQISYNENTSKRMSYLIFVLKF